MFLGIAGLGLCLAALWLVQATREEGGASEAPAAAGLLSEPPAADSQVKPHLPDPALLQEQRPIEALPGGAEPPTAAALLAQAREAALASMQYQDRVVSGRLVMADGGPLPAGLHVSVSVSRPPPDLIDIRASMGGQQLSPVFALDFPELGAVNVKDGSRLAELTRSAVAADGSFRIERAPVGSCYVRVEDALLYADPPGLVKPSQSQVELLLRRGAIVRGRVLDEHGAPVNAAVVTCSTPFDPWSVADPSTRLYRGEAVKTDAAGEFEVRQVPAGLRLLVSARDPAGGLQSGSAEVPTLRPGEQHELEVVLRPGFVLAGQVVTQQETPLAAVQVKLRRNDIAISQIDIADEGGFRAQATTDAEGRFAFQGLAPGIYDAQLAAEGWRRTRSERITLGEELPHAEVLLVADAGLSIAGRVVDGAGLGIVLAFLTASPPRAGVFDFAERETAHATSEAEGAFRITGLDSSSHEVHVRAKGFLAVTRKIEAGSENILITLEPSVSVSGMAVSLGDGEPLTDFQLTLIAAGGLMNMAQMGQDNSDFGRRRSESVSGSEDGLFTIKDVEPGSYDLRLTAAGFGTKTLKELEVPKEGVRGLVLMAAPESLVRGQVVAARTGEALANATVALGGGGLMELFGEGLFGGRPEAISDAAGHFVLHGLEAGAHTLNVTHARYRTLVLPKLSLDLGQERDLGVVRLASGGAVYGRVLDESRRGVRGVMVMVADAMGTTMKRDTSDEEGRFRVEGLPPGSYTVMRLDFRMDIGGGGSGMDFMKDLNMRSITLGEDEEQEVDLAARSNAGTRLHGTVSSGDGPVADAMITVLPQRGGYEHMNFTSSGPDGRFELTVAEGEYTLSVAAMGAEGLTAGSQPTAPMVEALNVPAGLPEMRRDIHLPGGVLHGVVRNAADGKALAGVRVLLERNDSGRPTLGIYAALGGRSGESYTGADGSFRFRFLPAGTYTVVAGGRNLLNAGTPGWSVTRVPDLEVLENSPGFSVRVDVQPAGSIKGRVLDERGSPVADLGVWAADAQGQWMSALSEVMPDATGGYAVHDLLPGTWTLAFRGQGAAFTLVPGVSVQAGQITPLDVTLPTGIPLSLNTGDLSWSALGISLSGPAGPIPWELVSMGDLVQLSMNPSLRPLGALAPGTYSLRVTSGAQVLFDDEVLLVAGSPGHVVNLPAP
ncbi:MAG: carboxypeptidase regulatory-like domain-containing protein [Planctomycetota bacterium]